MRALVLAFFMALTGLGVATAGEDDRKIEINIEKSGDAGDARIHWVGDGADIDGLEVGESRTLDDGVVVTRVEEGLTIALDGESIVIPDVGDLGADATNAIFVAGDAIDEDVHVRVVRAHAGHDKGIAMGAGHPGIMIASGKEIDAATQETLRSVLATAGYEDEVHFIQPGAHRVAVIRKEVEIVD